MNKELEEQLCRDFPHLTQNYGGDPSKTPFSFGFAHGDGWEKLLRKALEAIEAERQKLPPEDAAEVKLLQVKEKFGGIRIYLSTETPEMSKAVARADIESYQTCELCGTTGEGVDPTGKHWIRTLCAKCREPLAPNSKP